MRTPSKARTQRQATMRLPRLPRESKPQTEKNARSIRPRSASKHTTESPSTIAHAAHARAKNSAGKSQRRAARRGEFSTSSNESTASAPPPVLPRNRYATMSESNMPMRFPSPLANDVTLPHVATLSQFVASSIAGVPLRKRCPKRTPNARRVRDAFRTSARQPQKSRPFRVGFFVSDSRCMKLLRATRFATYVLTAYALAAALVLVARWSSFLLLGGASENVRVHSARDIVPHAEHGARHSGERHGGEVRQSQ